MTIARDKLAEALILFGGIVASIAAYADTRKAWISLCIMTVTLAADEGFVRFRRSQEKSAPK